MIFVGGARTSSKSIWAYHTGGGSLAWSYDTGDAIYSLHLDRVHDMLYAVGTKSTYNLWKFNSLLGGLLNQYYADNGSTEFETLFTLSLDTSGNIFVGGRATWNRNMFGKVPSTMDSITNFRPGDAAPAIARYGMAVIIDSNDDIWVGCTRTTTDDFNKYDSADLTTPAWSTENTASPAEKCLAISSTGKIIVGYNNGHLHCYDVSTPGAAEWSNTTDYGAVIRAVIFDGSDNMYVAWGTNLSKVSLVDGSQTWNIAHGSILYDLAVDASDNVFACGARAGGYTVWQLDTATPALDGIIDSGGTCRAIACSASGYSSFLVPRDVIAIKKLVVAANDKIYYEDE